MRPYLLLAAPILVWAGPAQAAVTVTAFDETTSGAFVENNSDAFDVAQGAMVTGSGPIHPSFKASAAIGGSELPSPEPKNLVFADGGVTSSFLTFQTAAPVAIRGFNLFLVSDNSPVGRIRSFNSIGLSGSLDGIVFTDLGSIALTATNYFDTYGSGFIRVTSTFAPAAYQFFRLDVTQPGTQFSGGRILELDAISPSAVPEPATWAMMIAGFGLAGAAARRRAPIRRVVA